MRSCTLDVLVQNRSDKKAANRLLRKQLQAPRVLISDKLKKLCGG